MSKIKKHFDIIRQYQDIAIFIICILGFIAELFTPERWCGFRFPFKEFETVMGIIGLVYCLHYTYIFIFKSIKRDWILAKGHFLIKVVNFVLLVPFILAFSIRTCCRDYSPKNMVFEDNLFAHNQTETDTLGTIIYSEASSTGIALPNGILQQETNLPSSITQEQTDPSLFWAIYFHFVDPGNQHMTTSATGRRTSAIVAVLGFFLLNGLLISMVISWFDRRREQWINGEIKYNDLLKRNKKKHYVIIGGNDIAQGLVKQLFNSNKGTPYIVILTSREIEDFRKNLFLTLSEKQQQHTIIYFGNRTSRKDIEELHIENAKEMFIIGEDTRSDDIESYHDTMNMECLGHVSDIIEKSTANSDKKDDSKLICRVMFEYQTTFSVFQFYDIDKNVGRVIDFRPFNYYELWAQKILINKEISANNIKKNFANGGFLPLEGACGIKENDDDYVHLFIVGMSRIGVSIAIEAAHLCHYPNYEKKKKRTRITFIDKNANEEKNFVMGRFKELFALSHWRYGNINENGSLEWNAQNTHIPVGYEYLGGDFLDIEWEFVNGGIESAAVQDYIMESSTPSAKVTIAICLPESNRSHAAALYLDKKIYDSQSTQQVLVYNRYGNAVIRAISDNGSVHPYCGKLRHFGYSNIEFLKDLKQSEEIGRKIDDVYCNIRIDNKYNPAKSNYKGKSAVANFWSSIYNGNTMWTKLRCIDFNPVTFINDESIINLLADVEHNRWNTEELLMNFRPLTFEEQQKEKAENNINKNKLKGCMAHTDICSNKTLLAIDSDARKYDIEFSKCLCKLFYDQYFANN
ncbi:MAG: hypothetical protein J6Q73_05105 [Bacteroidaceae bacterium]|nr:hypothetical protein [Bacteroidaceae bacterium]